MKCFSLLVTVTITSFLITACGGGIASYTCKDKLGCVAIGSNESIKIASLLTMSGPDQAYGVDAVRGVEIAITDQGKLLGHNIELVKTDDQCDEKAGEAAAQQLSTDKQIVGVIGATCSSASVPAAKLLSGAGFVLVSPSSTAPSLTDPSQHQQGFLRTIYNDKAQGAAIADFAFNVLGLRAMLTIHDGTAYPKELQQVACDDFEQLGGTCVEQIDLSTGQDLLTSLRSASALNPDAIYFPVYTDAGIAVTQAIPKAGFNHPALLSSDGLLSQDFIQKTGSYSDGMYLSGPADVTESAAFTQKYLARYHEKPIAAYHLQAYDAANMLFSAMQQSADVVGDKLYIQRQKLRDALYNMRGIKGLSTQISCSPDGDCAQPNIDIFQIANNTFKVIYP
jgi:branched-chain amino acid transport system substrate-binding protein